MATIVNDLSTNLLLIYDFDSSDGRDSTGNRNNATLGNTPTYSSTAKFGSKSVSLDYSAQQYVRSNVITRAGAWSLSMWVQFPTTAPVSNAGDVYLWTKQTSGSGYTNLTWTNTSGTTTLAVGDSGGSTTYNVTPSTGTWYHVVVTCASSSGAVRLYFNGSEVGTSHNQGNTGGSGFVAEQIGSWYANSITSDFIVDQLTYWNTELSSANVTTLYNSGNGIHSGKALAYVSADTWLDANAPTTNRDGIDLRVGDQGGSDGARTLIRFTTPPSITGVTIEKVELKVRVTNVGGSGVDAQIFQSSGTPSTAWVEGQATWNVYSTGNNWTASGGASDFSSTEIDVVNFVTGDLNTWKTFVLYGTGATNNSTGVDWNTTFNYMLRDASSAGQQVDFDRREDTYPAEVYVTYSGSTSVSVSATTLSATFSLPASSVSGGATVSPSTLSATFSTPTRTVTTSVSVSANALSATFSIPTYSVDLADATAFPAVLTMTISTIAPTVTAERYVEVTPSALTATFSSQAPVITVVSNMTASPSVLVMTFSIPVFSALGDFWQEKFPTPSDPFTDKVYNGGDNWSDKF